MEKEIKELAKIPREQLQKGKRGLLSVIFGRTTIIFMMVLIQIGLLVISFQLLNERFFAAYGGTMLLGFALVVYIINKPGNPAFKIAWIVPILLVPVFGALFYLFFNLQLDKRTMAHRIHEEEAGTASLLEQNKVNMEHLRAASEQMANLAGYLNKAGASAVCENTAVTYYPSGEAVLDTMLEALRNAKRFIFVEFFIVDPGYMWDTILEILRAKIKEGVEVRLIYDGMNDLFNLPKDYPEQLKKDGIRCRVFAPIVPALSTVQNNRDHRKILVVDGEIAFTGGINLADEYINRKERFGYWKDSAIMFRGEAVRNYTLQFLRMWNVLRRKNIHEAYSPYLLTVDEKIEGASGYIMPYADNPLDKEQVGELVYMDILNTATKYVHIMTPYLVLDHEMIVALTYAAKRGVDVKIIMPHIPDKKYAFLLARSYYNELLDAGVKIYEFLPGFVHSKVFVSDDDKAVVGSINLDFRSLYLSFECASLLYQNSEISKIEEDFENTLAQCIEVHHDLYNNQKTRQKIVGKILRFLAPMM